MSQVQVNTLIQQWRAKMVQEGKLRIIRRAKVAKHQRSN